MMAMHPSVEGRFITLRYVLRVFIKHKSYWEKGEGQVMSHPITIARSSNESFVEEDNVQLNGVWNPLRGQNMAFIPPAIQNSQTV